MLLKVTELTHTPVFTDYMNCQAEVQVIGDMKHLEMSVGKLMKNVRTKIDLYWSVLCSPQLTFFTDILLI